MFEQDYFKQETTAAAFMRVARKDPGEADKLEIQKQLIRDYAERNGVEVIKWYEEVGSGNAVGHPKMDELIADIQRGLVKVVITVDPARLFRNAFGMWRFTELCRQLGVTVHYVDRPQIDPESIEAVRGEIANESLHKIRSGWSKHAKKARLAAQKPSRNLPISYQLSNSPGEKQKLVLHPEQAKTVRQIYRTYLSEPDNEMD